jgi:hypothetical protein
MITGTGESTDAKTQRLARSFLDSLPDSTRSKGAFDFHDQLRTEWKFVPALRRGISLKDLDESDEKRAFELLASSLSEVGFKKVEGIRSLEAVLFELEGKNPVRDKELYVFTFFGEPSAKGVWGYRYEGHHVSLNFTYRDGQLISSTPQFLGTNPAKTAAGISVLSKEQDLAFSLLHALSPSQTKLAVISDVAPLDIVTSAERKVAALPESGISGKDLTTSQRKALTALIQAHAEVQNKWEQARRMTSIRLNETRFSWLGSAEPGKGHYYRIQSPTFLIEYDNTQNDANHIHTVWRDFSGDFGGDALAEHYHQAEHHSHHHHH